jgi:hypothetical protein
MNSMVDSLEVEQDRDNPERQRLARSKQKKDETPSK